MRPIPGSWQVAPLKHAVAFTHQLLSEFPSIRQRRGIPAFDLNTHTAHPLSRVAWVLCARSIVPNNVTLVSYAKPSECQIRIARIFWMMLHVFTTLRRQLVTRHKTKT